MQFLNYICLYISHLSIQRMNIYNPKIQNLKPCEHHDTVQIRDSQPLKSMYIFHNLENSSIWNTSWSQTFQIRDTQLVLIYTSTQLGTIESKPQTKWNICSAKEVFTSVQKNWGSLYRQTGQTGNFTTVRLWNIYWKAVFCLFVLSKELTSFKCHFSRECKTMTQWNDSNMKWLKWHSSQLNLHKYTWCWTGTYLVLSLSYTFY